jgi:hypothetical protein
MESKVDVPTNFYCPITGELMINPVTDKEGNTYEKTQILEWITHNKTSPITRNYLDETHLSDNIALKRSINGIKDQLREEQLSITTQIMTPELKEFTEFYEDIKLNSYFHNDKLFVNIQTPDIDVRPPVDIVLCIDVSYSMSEEASLKGDSNETIGHGFSVLSLTLTAAKTILHSLNETDNISVVTYSSEAKTIVENIACTPANKTIIESELDTLKPLHNTNMWSGIIQSLDILRTTSAPDKQKGILLLTDGIPNVEPPRGHVYMLEKYFRDHDFKCMMSCYGFGYNLNSELLMNLSRVSGGDGYSFIPDASILGTAFIHGLSNLLTTAIYNPTLTITLSKDVRFSDGQTQIEVQLDSLKYGQDKNLVFEVDTVRATSRSQDYLNDFAHISFLFKGNVIETNENLRPDRDYYLMNKYRQEAINIINNCIQLKMYNNNSFKDILIQFTSDIEKEKTNPYIQDLIYDFNGQIKEALNMTTKGEREDWFSKWGVHYLRSLQEAYQHELCNNFKDKGISHFGGELFNQLRDEISDIFDSQPPPKRDIKVRAPRFGGSNGSTQAIRVPVSMSVYNNAGGGCCAEGSGVMMEDHSYKKVENIQKGDRVVTCKIVDSNLVYSVSPVECVIKTKCNNGVVSMVTLGNLRITPYHPIIQIATLNVTKEWIFPCMIGKGIKVECESMYTFVVENRESMFIERSIFATYGHNVTEEIIRHDYFGTEEVINDLKKFPTYEEGIVELTQDKFVVDVVEQRGEHRVVGIRTPKEE